MYSYCFNDPINYVDYCGYFPRRIINNDPYIGIDDRNTSNEHVHITLNGKSYSWYRNSHKTRHEGDYGLNDLSKSAQKTLRKAGLPKDYTNKMIHVQLPRWQEGFSIVTMPRWQEGFSIVNLPPYQEGFSIVNLSPDQEGFSIVKMPRWQEGFSLPQIDRNTVATIIVAAGVVLIVVCVVGAFFTGGQSLWGLLALA